MVEVILLRDVLVRDRDDQFKRAAYIRDSGSAVLVDIGANHSMSSGMSIKLQELARWS
jgi:hypothetical protein